MLFDAGVFIGALLTGDSRHAEARPLVEAARRGEMLACTTTGILSEVYAALTWQQAQPPHDPEQATEAARPLSSHFGRTLKKVAKAASRREAAFVQEPFRSLARRQAQGRVRVEPARVAGVGLRLPPRRARCRRERPFVNPRQPTLYFCESPP